MKLTTSLLDYPYYFLPGGGPELFMWFVLLVVLPIAYFAIIRPLFASGMKRIVAVFVFLGVCTVAAFWDVAVIAWQAQRLCTQEAGWIFKTAGVEGFKANGDEEYLKQGFSYMEYELNPTVRTHATLVDGKVKRDRITELESTYELINDPLLYFCCNESRYVVRNRETHEVLGQLVDYSIYRGWADSLLLSVLPGFAHPTRCTGPQEPPSDSPKNEITITALVNGTLHPIKSHFKGNDHD